MTNRAFQPPSLAALIICSVAAEGKVSTIIQFKPGTALTQAEPRPWPAS